MILATKEGATELAGMAEDSKKALSGQERWARFKYSVVGPLFVAPPAPGELQAALEALAAKSYRDPTNERAIHLGYSTIERWYYDAKNAPDDPLMALTRKVSARAGSHPSMPATLLQPLLDQYRAHPSWTMQLHYDNLLAIARAQPELGEAPSYPTICRVMKAHGLIRQRRSSSEAARERRSFEVPHVHGLWHTDFHEGSRRVLVDDQWVRPHALAFLDDRSRLACHLQWYVDPNTEAVAHGLTQAILKRGVPRALLSDNGGPFVSGEITAGLERLTIIPYTTLPYSPEQNGKQESFWGSLERRLVAMLEGEPRLTLKLLNDATQAWVEIEYNQGRHSEIGMSPIACVLANPGVQRPAPDAEILRRCFRIRTHRRQRKSDGTITVEGVRFELPSRYRTLVEVSVRYARWDLSVVELVDPRSGQHLADLYPLDRQRNADGRRRTLRPEVVSEEPAPVGVAPHLRALMAEYAATGLPPAYLPLPTRNDDNLNDEGDPQ